MRETLVFAKNILLWTLLMVALVALAFPAILASLLLLVLALVGLVVKPLGRYLVAKDAEFKTRMLKRGAHMMMGGFQ